MSQRRVRILKDTTLKKEFHGKTGNLLSVSETVPPSGAPWNMFTVELDEMVPTNGVDGYIEHKTVCLPAVMFEDIVYLESENKNGTQHN